MTHQALNRPVSPIKLYHFPLSGHGHRVKLFLSLLGLPFEIIPVDLMKGEQKTQEFQKMNPFGQIPVIQDGDMTLADSNAILVYLAGKYTDGQWLPSDPQGAAKVQVWLSVAAGLVAFGPAAARAMVLFNRPFNAKEVTARANGLFDVMDQVLANSPFLVGDSATLADIANYSYIAHAPEGNVSLEPYPNLRTWIARIEALPGFVPMAKS